MSSPGPFAGVISPEICWSVHENELRVHSTAHLEPHTGHGTTGLPNQAIFRFSSEVEEPREAFRVLNSGNQSVADARESSGVRLAKVTARLGDVDSPKEADRGRAGMSRLVHGGDDGLKKCSSSPRESEPSPRERVGTPKTAAGKLPVRAVEAVELRDGRTILVCLVAEREVASEVHCVDPISGETLQVSTGLPILLTNLAVLPRLAVPARRRSAGLPAGETMETPAGGVVTDSVRLGGNTAPASGRASSDGHMCDGAEEMVVAVGGVGGRVTLVGLEVPTPEQHHDEEPNEKNVMRGPFRPWPPRGGGGESMGGVPSDREGIPISTLSAFSVPVRRVNEKRRFEYRLVAMIAVGWSDGEWAVAPCCNAPAGDGSDTSGGTLANSGPFEKFGYRWQNICSSSSGDLAIGDTGGLGPALHIVCQDDDVPSGESPTAPSSKFRLWISTASGFLCFEVSIATESFLPQVLLPIFSRRRALIPRVRPQSLRARVVGGGPSRPLMIFASIRPSDGSPILAILDTSTATDGAAISAAATPVEAEEMPYPPSARPANDGDGDGGNHDGCAWGKFAQEVHLSTRCCSQSVFSTSPHVVFVNPTEIKAFVCRRLGHGGNFGENFSPSSRAVTRSSFSGEETVLHLKFSVIVAEASFSESGRPRLRAWEPKHVGDAHRVAEDLERLGLLAFCDPSEHVLEAGTTLRIDAIGEASLEHVVGGPGNLWARPFCSDGIGTGEAMKGSFDFPARDGTEKVGVIEGRYSSRMLLAARLQSAVAVGRGPAIARALTATVSPVGGQWMLPSAGRIHEWASSVALEAWDEACSVLARLSPNGPFSSSSASPLSLWQDAAGPLDAIMRRCRQVERILESSVKRCRLYCAAALTAAEVEPATLASLLRQRRRMDLALAQQLAAESRMKEIAPLLSHLRRALLAARLAFCVSSTASWLHGTRLLDLPAEARMVGAAVQGESAGAGESSTAVSPRAPGDALSGSPKLVRPIPLHPITTIETAKTMIQRLIIRAGLSAAVTGASAIRQRQIDPRQSIADHEELGGSTGTGDGPTTDVVPGGTGEGGEPVAMLVEMTLLLRDAFEAADEVGFSEQEELPRPGQENATVDGVSAAVCLLLERGIAAVAYSVMNAAFSKEKAMLCEVMRSRDVEHDDARTDGKGALAEERGVLERVEALVGRFYEQVRLSPEPRVQARLSWLLDMGASSVVSNNGGDDDGRDVRPSFYLSTAASALLCPRALACLAADPGLLAVARAIFARFGGDGVDGVSNGSVGLGRSVYQTATSRHLYLAGELLHAARERARDRGDGTSSGKKRQRDSTLRSWTRDGGRTSSDEGKYARTSYEVPSQEAGDADTSERSHKKRSPTRQQQQQQQFFPLVATPLPPGSRQNSRRDRGCTVWETPRGVGLTPKTPSTRKGLPCPAVRRDEGCVDGADTVEKLDIPCSASSTYRHPRARGQTVWETPRGVGLTPKTPSASSGGLSWSNDSNLDGNAAGSGVAKSTRESEYPWSASSVCRHSRARGQTVWETPRGVGLTPKVPGASSRGRYWYNDGGESLDSSAGGGVNKEEMKNPRSASSAFRYPRARGQTVWETPRGVGLTPKTPADDLKERHTSSVGGGRHDDVGGGMEEQKGEEEHRGTTSSVYHQSRARGQTVWETPRGVGLTPRVSGEEHPGSSSSVHHQPRARGQTLWETPRGMGLTPKTSGAGRIRASLVDSSDPKPSSSSEASPVVAAQHGVRAYAQGRS